MFRNIEKLDEMKIQGKKGVRKLRISLKREWMTERQFRWKKNLERGH